MEYKKNDKIPNDVILIRLQDEDGAFYLELKGEKDYLYRVGAKNSLFFKLEKTGELMRRLKIVDDYRRLEDYSEQVKQDSEPDIEPSDEITLKIDVAQLQKKLREITFDEGRKIPDGLKNKCKQNTYGGYSLEYNNYLYVLDSDFRVEIKKAIASTAADFTMEAESMAKPSRKGEDTNKTEIMGERALNRGDLLPENLRSRCDLDLSSGSGFRIEIGGSIYILDEDYRVVVKMSQTVHNAGEPAAARVEEIESKKQETKHPPEKIVESVSKKFKIALKVDRIEADLFLEKTLGETNKPVLLKVYRGDLSELNEDTKTSAGKGNITKVDGGGISLLKAAMLHELYLKSTYRGRGARMIEFLTHIISPWKDAALTISQEDLPLMDKEKLVDLLKKRSVVYKDLGDALYQIYSEIKGNIQSDYEEVRKEGKTLFKAFLIDKLYLMISRPDKGDGISLICLARDIMDFRGA